MGGYHGGRAAQNLLAESGLHLRIADIRGDEPIRAGTCRWASISWHNSHTGKSSGAVAWRLEAWEETGTLFLRLAIPDYWTGEVEARRQDIGLEALVQPGGGLRWFFICPRSNSLCTVLHCPPGSQSFAGRAAWRMSYTSQRRSRQDRPLERARSIRMALGGSANMAEPFPTKPLRMRWTTFDRLKAKAEKAERSLLAFQVAWLDAVKPGWRDRPRSV